MDTRLDTPPFSGLRHPNSRIARDTATGHVFTFTVKPSRLVGRLLSEAKYVTSENSKVRPEDVVRFVWNFAQMQMKQEGKIDRVIVW